ncbi:hypothetical protein ACWELB_03190 [Streptomyces asiaticus]|uniref:hypothetical protein n=1 Tax=Streptomyces asiaticus TaxID=114695 RepID=UPI0039BDBEF0
MIVRSGGRHRADPGEEIAAHVPWQPIPSFLRWSQPAGTRDHLAGEVEHPAKAGEHREGIEEPR